MTYHHPEAHAEGQTHVQTRPTFKSGFVAIVGRPNVGKSTLLNSLLDFKLSIVTPKPQTTRHKILGILSGADYQVVLLDTPGFMQKALNELDRGMLHRISEAVRDADLVVLVVEPRPPGETEQRILAQIKNRNKPAILAINKVDAIKKSELLPVMEDYANRHPFLEILPISALKSDGVNLLLDLVLQHLPQGEPYYPTDEITDRWERFLVAEIVREKVFHHYGAEVPYSTAVSIDEFKEGSPEHGNKDYIRAIIYVERDSQKKILIGAGGRALKTVGTEARQESEVLLGRPIFLELWVKVRKQWRKDSAFVKQLGY